MFPTGSHHWALSQSAELTGGVATVTNAVDAKAAVDATNRRRTDFLITDLPARLSKDS